MREQGWLADRALEAVLRRQKRLYSVERRAAAEALYGILRAQGRIEWLLAHRAGPAELERRAVQPVLRQPVIECGVIDQIVTGLVVKIFWLL